MKYLDERVIFDFSGVYVYNGLHRYDVKIDDELVFIGNAYSTPVLDITDILVNYFESKAPAFTSTPSKSGIIKKVAVTYYGQMSEETISEDVMFIYRQPNYNSKVTTPILDDLSVRNIGLMPMLQGWDRSTLTGAFLPTYPVNPSDVMTFDFVGAYQNAPFINSYQVNYSNGQTDSPIDVSVPTGGDINQYSIPMSTLIRGISEDITLTPSKTSDYFYYRAPGWTLAQDTNTLKVQSSTSSVPIDGAKITYTSKGLAFVETMTNESPVSNVFASTMTINFDPDFLPETIRVELLRGNVRINMVTFTPQNLPDNITSMEIEFGAAYNSLQKISTVTLTPVINYNRSATNCEATSIDLIAFSPLNSGQRYKQTVAKLDNKSRYFLKWRDRYGMPQIQPFSGTHTYKETLTKSTATNWKNTKKLIDNTVQPSWLLNTDWINQELYPFYESIYVSPYLQLYDAKEDKLYNVILTDKSYSEKTFNNQNRKLFNLQLTVELDTIQKIIY